MNRKYLMISLIVFGLLLCVTSLIGVSILNKKTINQESVELFVYPNDSYEKIVKDLEDKNVIDKNSATFSFIANLRGLKDGVKSGRYLIESQTTILDLVKKLDNGLQTPVKLVINKVRLHEDFAKKVSQQLMLSENDILLAINQSEDSKNFFDRVVCNTYEVYWTITPEKFVERMKKEYEKFWNTERTAKAAQIGLTPQEVSVLASIVCEETNYGPEMPRVAGVYMNRLKRGMKLDADPTVKFALGDPTIKRILFRHLNVDSPYNTYKNIGLPPGPITIPSIKGIESVLGYEKHNYLYFCASPAMDGTHRFARTLVEHNRNAREYQAVLNKMKIR